MTLKERLSKLGETRKAVRAVEGARLKKEHEAREADIDKKAKELSDELDVPKETARKYIKAQKVGELRTARRAELKEKAVKVGRTIKKYAEETQKAQAKAAKKKGGGSFYEIKSDFFGDVLSTPKKPKRKTKSKTKKKRSMKKGKKPKEIRIIID